MCNRKADECKNRTSTNMKRNLRFKRSENKNQRNRILTEKNSRGNNKEEKKNGDESKCR